MQTALNFSQHLPGVLIAASVVVLSFFVVMSLRAKMARRSREVNPRKFIHDIREKAGMASEGLSEPDVRHQNRVQSVVELEKVTRRLTAHMDTRIAILEKLIRDADQRIENIRSVIDTIPGASISPTKIADSGEAAEAPFEKRDERRTIASAKAGGPRNVRENDPADQSRSSPRSVTNSNGKIEPVRPERTSREIPNSEPAPRTDHPNHGIESTNNREKDADPLTASVYELADRGLQSVAIAQNLDEHVGKVELILALRSSEAQVHASP